MKTNKKLISLMLAGAMVAGVGAMATGCKGTEKIETSNGATYEGGFFEQLEGKNLIVALYEKKITLHRAEVYLRYREGNPNAGWVDKKVVTDCMSEEEKKTGILVDPYRIIVYPSVPDETAYDVLCEECFGNK